MKRLHYVIFFCILAFLWSCGTKSGVSTTVSSEPAGKLFLEAEEQFQAKSYDNALELYQDYLITYSDQPLAPAALMKIGAINSLLGDYAQAHQAYQYLINEYPAVR
jgi:outer membrane protein assembly factor BamD (BamD/ComL family)